MTPDFDKLYGLIETWLDGGLSPDEATAFTRRVETEEDLRFRVEQHRLAREAIGQWVAEDYKSKIKSWKIELDESPLPVSKSPASKWWVIGVGLLLLVAGSIWYFIPPPTGPKTSEPTQQAPVIQKPEQPVANGDKEPPFENPTIEKAPSKSKKQEAIAQNAEKTNLELPNEELIAMADAEIRGYKAYLDETIKTRGEGEPDFKLGKEALTKNEYLTARQYFEKIAESSPNYNAALQLLAFTYYKEKNYPKAVDIYEQFAPRKIGQSTDWWLIQFYQADYSRSKANFWKKLNEMVASPRNSVYKAKAVQLKEGLREKGLKEE